MDEKLKEVYSNLKTEDILSLLNNKELNDEAENIAQDELVKRGVNYKKENSANVNKSDSSLSASHHWLLFFILIILHCIFSDKSLVDLSLWRDQPILVGINIFANALAGILGSIVFILPFVFLISRKKAQKRPTFSQLNRSIFLGLLIRSFSYFW